MADRILFVSESCGFIGGVETFLHRAALILRAAGIRCSGVFLKTGPDTERFQAAFDRVGFGPAGMAELSCDCDVIWVQKAGATVLAEPYCGKIPLAIYVHDHDYYCFRRHKYFPFTRRNCTRPASGFCRICGALARKRRNWGTFVHNLQLLRRADRVISNSEFMLENLRQNGVRPDRLLKIPPPLNRETPPAIPPKPDSNEILYVGQLIRGKGVDQLLSALSRLELPWHLTVLGDGNDADFCKKMAKDLKIDDRIRWQGFVPETTPYYRNASVVAFPSRWQEPFGMVGPEALQQGVPVAGFRIGGAAEWMTPGNPNVYPVEPGDIDGFAAALKKALTRTPQEALRNAQAGQQAVAQYTPEHFAVAVKNMLETLQP